MVLQVSVAIQQLTAQPFAAPLQRIGIASIFSFYQESFTRGKGCFSILGNVETLEKPDAEYPLILVTGRRREHYNNGSMTRRCSGLLALVPEELVEIHPDDAARRNRAARLGD